MRLSLTRAMNWDEGSFSPELPFCQCEQSVLNTRGFDIGESTTLSSCIVMYKYSTLDLERPQRKIHLFGFTLNLPTRKAFRITMTSMPSCRMAPAAGVM